MRHLFLLIDLLKQLFRAIKIKSNDVVLDFFAGSGSTAQAVVEMSKEIEQDIKFVCVQLPHQIDEGNEAFKAGFKSISEITKERIRRVSSKIKAESRDLKIDLGFKAISLQSSNYKSWKNYQGTSTQDLEQQLDMFNQNPLREGYTKDGLLSEVMLLEGFTLCSDISPLTEIDTNSIKRITSEYCEHALLVCLDETIEKETIASLHLGDADIFICLDSAVSTEDKLRLSDKGLIKTI